MKNEIIISINSNKGSFERGNPVVLNKMYEKYKVRHPNAFFVKKSTGFNFDGFIKYISATGSFNIGLLPMVCRDLKELGCVVKIVDKRKQIDIKPKVPKKLGDKELRGIQLDALKSILYNNVEGISFKVGVINASTNFGKTLLMAALFEAYHRKLKVMVLVNNSQLFKQTQKEMPLLLPGANIKWIQGKERTFGDFNIGMVQTLAPNVRQLQSKLESMDMVLIDECDLADNKSYKTVISHLYNTTIRIGLSGSIYLSKLKKDLMKNMNLRSFMGDELHITTKEEMRKLGYSANVIIKICQGNQKDIRVPENMPYLEAYKYAIINNPFAKECSLNRTKYNLVYNRLPALIVVQFIEHAEELYKYYKKSLGSNYSIAMVHHKTKDKDKLIERFRTGKLDIMIISFIVKRGLNLPKALYMQNAAGSNSEETILQLMGRMERKEEGKNKTYLDDLFYYGHFFLRHSKHRVNYYTKQENKVINLVKPKNLKKRK